MSTSIHTPRLCALVALAAVGASAAVIGNSGAAAQAPATGAPPIAFKELDKGSTQRLVDLAPKSHGNRGPIVSPGDQLVFSNPLATASGEHLGKLYAHCTALTGASLFRSRLICEGVFTFARGTMTLTTLTTVGAPTSGAITGGTGIYANARGTFASTNTKSGSDVVVTLVN